MKIELALYLIDVLASAGMIDGITLAAIVGISVIAIPVFAATYDQSNEEERKKELNIMAKSFYKKMSLAIAIMVALLIIIPGKQTMYLMLGASALKESNLPHKVSEALELKLDDIIKDLKEEKAKK